MSMSPKVSARAAGASASAIRQTTSPQRQQGSSLAGAASWQDRRFLIIAHLRYLHIGGQVQPGFLDTGEQIADDGEGIDLIEPSLVVENQSMIEYGSGDNLDIFKANRRPCGQQCVGASGLGDGDGGARRGSVRDVAAHR